MQQFWSISFKGNKTSPKAIAHKQNGFNHLNLLNKKNCEVLLRQGALHQFSTSPATGNDFLLFIYFQNKEKNAEEETKKEEEAKEGTKEETKEEVKEEPKDEKKDEEGMWEESFNSHEDTKPRGNLFLKTILLWTNLKTFAGENCGKIQASPMGLFVDSNYLL